TACPRCARHCPPRRSMARIPRFTLSELILRLNAQAKSSVLSIQEYFILAWNSLRFMFARPFYAQVAVQPMDDIGMNDLGIVLLTGLFTGMVLALQSSVQL